MKPNFVETANVREFHAKFDELERRGAEEACLMLVDGEPGLGKTTALYHWVTQTQSIYLRANAEWNSTWFMNDLLEAFRIRPKHAFQDRFKQAMEALLLRQQHHLTARKPFAVVVDEADHVSKRQGIMETIRDFSDGGDIPFILVGMGKIRDNLARFPQIASRMPHRVRFQKAGIEDVTRFAQAKCEVTVAPDLIAFVHRASGGFNREIKEALTRIERFAGRNGIGAADRPVTLRDMRGQALVDDRRTSTAITVPEAA